LVKGQEAPADEYIPEMQELATDRFIALGLVLDKG